jgi:hypothetical protein
MRENVGELERGLLERKLSSELFLCCVRLSWHGGREVVDPDWTRRFFVVVSQLSSRRKEKFYCPCAVVVVVERIKGFLPLKREALIP